MEWQAVGVILSFFTLLSGFLALWIKHLLEQNRQSQESRFNTIEESLKYHSGSVQELRIGMEKMQAELPGVYMRREECARCREDWTYMQSVIDGKLDILHRKLGKLWRKISERKPDQ